MSRKTDRNTEYNAATQLPPPPYYKQYLHSGRSDASQILCYSEVHTQIQVSAVEMRTAAHWTMTGCSMPLSSSLRPPSSHCAFISARKD
jgi:hypothetical protein